MLQPITSQHFLCSVNNHTATDIQINRCTHKQSNRVQSRLETGPVRYKNRSREQVIIIDLLKLCPSWNQVNHGLKLLIVFSNEMTIKIIKFNVDIRHTDSLNDN